MKGVRTAIDRLIGITDTPLSFDRGLPEIRISAMHSMVIEPHRGIRSFSDDSILIETGGGLVHIRGSALMIKSMTWRELCLQGRFRTVELVGDHAV
jgi:sporulation protein YqfC